MFGFLLLCIVHATQRIAGSVFLLRCAHDKVAVQNESNGMARSPQ